MDVMAETDTITHTQEIMVVCLRMYNVYYMHLLFDMTIQYYRHIAVLYLKQFILQMKVNHPFLKP